MCGFTGYIGRNKIESEDVIKNMMALIVHRGPDDAGISVIPCCEEYADAAVGFRRLSIIDVSKNGHQPMFDYTQNVCICFNGEIYNAEEYRYELQKKGYHFRGTSDTEILLNLYLEYGIEGMLDRINGMFAICIMDHRIRRMYLVRDRLGIKPLYYYLCPGILMFSSEIKTFYAHPDFDNELNEEAFDEYLMFRFVAGRETLIKNVYQVRPGHYFSIEKDLSIKEHCYWQLPEERNEEVMDDAFCEQELNASVKRRLISDVRLGVQLSGGIDSSIVLYEASKATGKRMDAFSIVLEDESLTEKKWIDIAAGLTNAVSHQYTWTKAGFGNLIKKMTWHLDMPLNHPNTLGIYLLSQMARNNGIKVLLSGEGADELFGGYRRYVRFLWSKTNSLLAQEEDKRNGIHRRWRKEYEGFLASSSFCDISDMQKLCPGFDAERAMRRRVRLYEETPGEDCSMQKYLNYDMQSYLVSLLERQDKMSMAASVENRVPFLDHKFVEKVRMQKCGYYISPDKEGSILCSKKPIKRIAEKIFGKEFTYRPKSGFTIPLNDFLSETDFCDAIKTEYLPFLKDINKFDGIEERVMRLGEMTPWEVEKGVWQILSFAIWGSMFLGDKNKVVRGIQ